jgi:hypothetical protein
MRDPLLAIISGLRRKGPEAAEGIIAGVSFLATKQDECFFFCVDQWQHHRERALALLSYLDLEPTQEIYDYLARWPSPNAAEAHEHLIHDKSADLAEARRLVLAENRLHPIVAPWALRLRQAGLQPGLFTKWKIWGFVRRFSGSKLSCGVPVLELCASSPFPPERTLRVG